MAELGVAAGPSFVGDSAEEAVLVLEPHGLRFAEPVTVTMTLAPALAADPDNIVLLRLDDEADTTWEPVGPFTIAGDQLSFETSTFSVILAAQIAAGACPCWTGADLAAFIAAVNANGDTPTAGRGYGGWMMASDPPSRAPAHMLAMAGWGGWCKWQGPVARWSEYYPSVPAPSGATGTTATQVRLPLAALPACNALGARALAVSRATNLGVAASGLGAGEAVTINIGAEAIVLRANDALSWFSTAYAPAEPWSLTVLSPPANKTCTLSAPTGVFRDQNELVTVTCVERTSCDSTCDSLEGDWDALIVETDSGVVNDYPAGTQPLVPTTAYPAGWAAPVAGQLYEAGGWVFFIQLAPDGTIDAFMTDMDASGDPISFDESYTCDAATGAQELRFSFTTTDAVPDWRIDVILTSL